VAILMWMVQWRRPKLAYLLVSLLLLPASLHPSTAYSAAGDPPSGSPAGAVYQLPLEQGRSDAAPKGSGEPGVRSGGDGGPSEAGRTTSSGDPSESGSLYRTENNFGSSSHVPGVTSTGGGGAGGATGGGGGGSAAIPGGAVAADAADTGNTSITAGIVLIAAIALLATAVGVLSRRFRGRAVD
jgi:hypothetical protein